MGAKKPKASKAKAGSKVSKTISTAKSLLSGGKSSSGKRRSSKMTPERLSKKILVEKLKKRLFRIKYGGGR